MANLKNMDAETLAYFNRLPSVLREIIMQSDNTFTTKDDVQNYFRELIERNEFN